MLRDKNRRIAKNNQFFYVLLNARKIITFAIPNEKNIR